jgi:hypothetical protein
MSITQPDGSLLFKPEEFLPMDSLIFKQDPDNPLKFTYNFVPCVKRRLVLARTKCGNITADYRCDQFGCGVNVTHCKLCQYDSKQPG